MTLPNKVSCIICRKETNNLGLSGHFRIVHLGQTDFMKLGSAATRGKPSWNSGKTAATDKRIAEGAAKASATLKGRKGHSPSQETRMKTSNTMKGRTGGYRRGSGVGKSGWYNGIWCDSTWELAFVIWCKENGKLLERNSETFKYFHNGSEHKYLPDFIVDGQLIEIKGRKVVDELTAAKIAATEGKVKLMLHDDMKPILESVKHLQPLERLYGG